jgi:hypothetical protein
MEESDITNDWDVKIILDACRYDVFKSTYKSILGQKGKFSKKISNATHTIEWLNKTFLDKKMKDTIYISANPFVNSKGKVQHRGFTFDGKKHFKKVIDVWDFGWDKKLKTIHPKEVNKSAFVTMALNRKDKFIIHYMQPHQPSIYFQKKQLNIEKNKMGKKSNVISIIGKLLGQLFSHETVWKFGKIFKLKPNSSFGKLWYTYGREEIIKGYNEDVKLVLKFVKVLIDKFPNKKFLITSDHGERLGENGYYGHGGKRDKEVIEVPLLVM